MIITLDHYFRDYREKYPLAYTPDIGRSAAITVNLANKLLENAALRRVNVPGTLSSGWRPPAVNAKTPGAATNSKHMTGKAIDIIDPEGDLDEWLMTREGQAILEDLGLWLEHPATTKGWSHLQIVPPGSGNRVFYP